ncbi:MAG: hypothetical protein IKP37_04435 [Paludibacteraceae bacterium]|nr:hypothetical protein [Paludibacteraceae bacterium]
MIIANQIKSKLDSTECGVVLTMGDFGIEAKYQPALVKALNRLVSRGDLEKISKGKYFKPQKSIFGILKPSTSEIVKDFLEKDGKTVGYITGATAFASMGLTTQISSVVLIGTNFYRRPLERGAHKVSFLLQRNEITEETIPLLRILDAFRLIKDIPATTPDESLNVLKKIIAGLSAERQLQLVDLASKYTPYVRALLGAVFEILGKDTNKLNKQLNGVTYYKIPISEKCLPNKKNWNII